MGVQEQVGVVQAYAAATVTLRERLAAAVEATWLGLGSWRSDDADAFVATVAPLVDGAVAAMAAMTDAYLSALLGDMTGRVLGAGAARGEYPRPAPSGVVYRRPFATLWTALSSGSPFPDALQAGRARAVNLATTDLQLAKRSASQARLAADPRVVAYRRVLTGSRSCALCALATTQRYRKRDLLPIHPGCNCAVAPIVGDKDPGRFTNVAWAKDQDAVDEGDFQDLGVDVDSFHGLVAERFPPDYQGRTYRDLVVVHQHGELGPVLTRKGDQFTGPEDMGINLN